jgi:hypothetical protein
MKKNRLVNIIFICILVQFAFAQTGETGLQFLQIGVGARACAMGEAFTALSDDASAIYWNSAGLSLISQKEFLFMHNEWLAGTRYEFLSCIAPLSNSSSMGAALTYFSYGDIEARDELGHHLPDYTAYDFALSLSYSCMILNNLFAGLTGKVIQSKIENEGGFGFASDVGLLYMMPIKGLLAGVSFQNFGIGMRFIDETAKLPMIFRSGVSYALPLNLVNIIPTVDFVKEIYSDYKTNIGLEVNLMNRISLRGGCQVDRYNTRMTAGIGMIQKVSWFQMNMDYAYSGYGNLGMSHRISLGLNF